MASETEAGHAGRPPHCPKIFGKRGGGFALGQLIFKNVFVSKIKELTVFESIISGRLLFSAPSVSVNKERVWPEPNLDLF